MTDTDIIIMRGLLLVTIAILAYRLGWQQARKRMEKEACAVGCGYYTIKYTHGGNRLTEFNWGVKEK